MRDAGKIRRLSFKRKSSWSWDEAPIFGRSLHEFKLALKSGFHLSRLPMEASVMLVPVQHIRTAQRYRALGRPPIVHNFEELHTAIGSFDLEGYSRTLDGHHLVSFRCTGHDSLVVTTMRQLELSSSAELIHADATYKVVPKGFGQQLFTVHGSWGGQVRVSDLYCASLSNDHLRDVYRVWQDLT